MHDHRLPLLLLAISLPVTTSYGRVYSLSPHLGDVGGGMRVNLTGRDFVDYGDVRCRFGTNAWTRATVDTATSMHCLTPANFSDQLLFPLASPSGRVDVPVEVTFNGVTWSSSDTWFAFYDLANRALVPPALPLEPSEPPPFLSDEPPLTICVRR